MSTFAYAAGGSPGGAVAGQASPAMALIPVIFSFVILYVFYKYVHSIINLIVGGAIIIFRLTFFKEVPLIGTVFTIPGDSILNAQIAPVEVIYGVYLYAAAFIAIGVYKLSVTKNIVPGRQIVNTPSNMSLDKIKEAKQLLEEGAITEEEFNKIKDKVIS